MGESQLLSLFYFYFLWVSNWGCVFYVWLWVPNWGCAFYIWLWVCQTDGMCFMFGCECQTEGVCFMFGYKCQTAGVSFYIWLLVCLTVCFMFGCQCQTEDVELCLAWMPEWYVRLHDLWKCHCACAQGWRLAFYCTGQLGLLLSNLNRPHNFPASPEVKSKPSFLKIDIRVHFNMAVITH